MEHANYLLVGGGVTSVHAANAIRQRDPSGTIAIVAAEPNPPTDRPPLSKQYLRDDSWAPDDPESKAPEFYIDNQIDLKTGVRVTSIDRNAKTVALDNGSTVKYDKLLIATGGSARALGVPGGELDGVAALRTVSDATDLRRRMKDVKRVVVVGAGFIGLEVAAVGVARGLETIVVGSADRPFAGFASAQLGKFVADVFRDRGVEFHFGDSVASFSGDGRVAKVVTRNGMQLECGLAVVGIGIGLNSSIAAGAELKLDDRGAILVDSHLRTADPSIWAAGDVAAFPDQVSGRTRHVEHFLNAKWQGATVGANMAGDAQVYDKVAYAYTDLFDLHFNVRGDECEARSTKVVGDMRAGEFVELYADAKGVLKMTVAVSRDDPKLDRISDAAEGFLREGATAESLSPSSFGL